MDANTCFCKTTSTLKKSTKTANISLAGLAFTKMILTDPIFLLRSRGGSSQTLKFGVLKRFRNKN